MRHIGCTLAWLVLLMPAAARAQPGNHGRPFHADSPVRPAAESAIALNAGTGRLLTLAGAAANVFAADPKIVEVRPASPTSLFVFGIAPGQTTVAALDAQGHPIRQFDVTVRASAFGAQESAAAIRDAMPGQHVRLHAEPNSMALTGNVSTAVQAQEAATLAHGNLGPNQALDNRLQISSSIQVGLHVRIAEMSRQVTRELGVNWTTLGTIGSHAAVSLVTANGLTAAAGLASLTGSYASKTLSIDGVIDALAQDNLVHVLAEPTLIATSGEPASFLVGGEYPIPVSTGIGGAVSITYRQYGVSLSFVPTVLDPRHISLHVRPEVSELTSVGAVQLSAGNSSIQIPALTVRRAETTVELGSGQSFAIAGLLQDKSTQSDQKVPWLGEVPVLGPLFRSDSFQHDQTELVIIVTPFIINPVSAPGSLKAPDDGFVAPDDADRLREMRQRHEPVPAASHGSERDGFIIQ